MTPQNHHQHDVKYALSTAAVGSSQAPPAAVDKPAAQTSPSRFAIAVSV